MKSEMLKVHEAALSSTNTVYHEFLLAYKESKREVYGFVEGREDLTYYTGLIESKLPDNWNIRIICSGNKKKVLDVFSIFNWNRFNKKRICFFIDRDLSIFTNEVACNDTNIYLTDTYSLENQIATPRVLVRTLKEIFGLIELSEDEEEKIKKEYSLIVDRFSEELVPVMCQIVSWRKQGSKACLDNIKMNDIFILNQGTIEVKLQCKSIDEQLCYAAKATNETISSKEELRQIEIEFRNQNGKELYIRGKYILWLFIEYAKFVHENFEKYSDKIKKKPKVKASIGLGNAMEIIAPRARLPSSLVSFLDRNHLEYISLANTQGSFAY